MNFVNFIFTIMNIFSSLISDMFLQGIKSNTIRARFSLMFGLGTMILIYAILNVTKIDIQMFVYSTLLSTLYFFILTPRKKE